MSMDRADVAGRKEPSMELEEKEKGVDDAGDASVESRQGDGRSSKVRRKSRITKRQSKLKCSLRVSFDENVEIYEYEDPSRPEVDEEEKRKKEEMLRNLFSLEDEEKKSAQNAEKVSGWTLASSMIAVSKRFAVFAKNTFSSLEEDNEADSKVSDGGIEPGTEEGCDDSEFTLANSHFLDDTSSTDSKERANVKRTISDPVKSGFKNRSTRLARRRLSTTDLVRPKSSPGLKSSPAPKDEHARRRKSLPVVGKVRSEKTDPFQFFEVKEEPCRLLRVRVLCGRNITKGRLQDMIDTPDPYVVVHIKEAPGGRKATQPLDNDVNPVWNEELVYLLSMELEPNTIADILLMDSNYSVDELYGSVKFDISTLPLDATVKKTFHFNQTSEVDIEFRMEKKTDNDLRSSLALCEEEKKFRSARKRVAQDAMKELMQEKLGNAPWGLREVPVVAVIGSGGGFRAMTGYSGAMKALYDTGILDCATYVCGLSGSSWYLATLYANEDFPDGGTDAVNAELRNNIQTSPFWLLRPECLMRYSARLREKMKSGQPVTFTDLFGMLIGQTLLGPKKMNTAKLSDFAEKIKSGKAPMPLLTCLHVRPKTSALTFHDWVEFTPYEIGMAKYGTFMRTQHFGSKFYKGVLAKQFDECPLHFLMGVWGSAFSILFNRLMDKGKGAIANDDSKTDDIRQEMERELHEEIAGRDDNQDESSDVEFESDDEEEKKENNGDQVNEGEDDDDDDFEDALGDIVEHPKVAPANRRQSVLETLWNWGTGSNTNDASKAKQDKENKGGEQAPPPTNNRGFLSSLISGVFGANFMESREYRAGKILNYMRGLSLNNTYPLSPFSESSTNSPVTEEDVFQQIHEPIEVEQKRVHLVDAGLTFNSPYPAMLRPQRSVDLIISFDFSARPGDNTEPFKEILLAEKWARMHKLPFPEIDRTVYEKEGMKECYVFKNEEDENAPTIVHFVLCNVLFRKFKKPGVPRAADDHEGDFNIFDTPKTPYSTFNFQYSNQAFDRLHRLMEFNTLLHVDTIIREMGNCVTLRRHSKSRGSVTLKDVRNSIYLSAKSRESLEKELLSKSDDGRFVVD